MWAPKTLDQVHVLFGCLPNVDPKVGLVEGEHHRLDAVGFLEEHEVVAERFDDRLHLVRLQRRAEGITGLAVMDGLAEAGPRRWPPGADDDRNPPRGQTLGHVHRPVHAIIELS